MTRFAPLVLLLCSSVLFAQDAPKPVVAPFAMDRFEALPAPQLARLDLDAIAAEDALNDYKGRIGGWRFAMPQDGSWTPVNAGAWEQAADGSWIWRLRVESLDAAHLNFGFGKFHLPPGASLSIQRPDGLQRLGPYTERDHLVTGQLWTPVLAGPLALIELRVPEGSTDAVVLELSRIAQGYRGFGAVPKHAKSGSCNMDVACLGESDPWNEPRGSVGAYTRGGSDICTGSLVNNTNNDRRMLFATAAHCGNTSGNVASVLVYWRYENPICRTPGSGASGTPIPRPTTTSQGLALLAATNNPFGGGGAANTRSDWALLELSEPNASGLDLHWAGWDRRGLGTSVVDCLSPPLGADPSETLGLCASIHHPGVDEKRITFVDRDFEGGNIASASDVHWHSYWAGSGAGNSPPVLPNIPDPVPDPVPNGVTEPGSSGSPLYNAERRIIGVLSGGPAACGSTGENLSDFYGALFHAYEGVGVGGDCSTTPPLATTCMRPYLDPAGLNPEFINGIGECDPPAPPSGLSALANGDNRIDLSWNAAATAERYTISRALGSCPGSGYTVIATDVLGTSFSDLNVSGNATYSYRISATDDDQPCTSGFSTCVDATATGICTLGPEFAGAASAQSAGQTDCAIDLAWQPANSVCGAQPPTYTVFRSEQPDFTPAPANQIATCVSGSSFNDPAVEFGTEYFYIVQAEDETANGTGSCNLGNVDGNLVRRSASPAGPDQIGFNDDMESGDANWNSSGSGAGAAWAIVSTASNSPTRSWFVADPGNVSDWQLAMVNGIPIPAGVPASLSFWHRYATEANWDGGVLEYSVDGGNWFDILAGNGAGIPANAGRFNTGGYVGPLNSTGSNPLRGRPAWHGSNGASFTRVEVDLAQFGGSTVRFRFRSGSDGSVSGTGWWVDDVAVSSPTACEIFDPDRVFRNGFEDDPALP
jgi:hypothetical protein